MSCYQVNLPCCRRRCTTSGWRKSRPPGWQPAPKQARCMSRAGLSGCATAAALGRSTCLGIVGGTGRPERPVLLPLKTVALPDLTPDHLPGMKAGIGRGRELAHLTACDDIDVQGVQHCCTLVNQFSRPRDAGRCALRELPWPESEQRCTFESCRNNDLASVAKFSTKAAMTPPFHGRTYPSDTCPVATIGMKHEAEQDLAHINMRISE